jgi:hypothetical protein
MHSVEHGIGGLGVGLQLVNKFSELLDIVSHSGCLLNMEELANEQFFLIAVETIMEETSKVLPIDEIKLEFNGLKSSSSSTVEMLFGNSNPKRRWNNIHLEVIGAEGTLVTRVVTVETPEGQFGKATSGMWSDGVSGNVWRSMRWLRRRQRWRGWAYGGGQGIGNCGAEWVIGCRL